MADTSFYRQLCAHFGYTAAFARFSKPDVALLGELDLLELERPNSANTLPLGDSSKHCHCNS